MPRKRRTYTKPEVRSKWVAQKFVAWDGEGYDTGDTHHYNYLSACWLDGMELCQRSLWAEEGKRLSSREILGFILDVSREVGPEATHVGFSMVYDFTHWLHDFEPKEVQIALHNTRKFWGWHRDFGVKLGLRKFFTVMHKTRTKKRSMTIWDVYGFFQSSFVRALETWLPDFAYLDDLRYGKAGRGDFAQWSRVDIEDYNRKELFGLLLLMGELRRAIEAMGVTLTRWDGAGALATAAFRRYMPKGWFQAAALPPEVEETALYGYFGGRIEMFRFGTYHGKIYHADINSAYPAALVDIPDLTRGTWHEREAVDLNTLPTMSLVQVSWDLRPCVAGPLPLRAANGTITFPLTGGGWYWLPEVQALQHALDNGHIRGKVTYDRAWVFEPEDPQARPFAWVQEQYNHRQKLIEEHGKQGGLQKTIKLMLNSLYGKTAQRLGYQPRKEAVTLKDGSLLLIENEFARRPPFYNVAIAGYITSHCRAKIYRAIAPLQDHVIAVMTDGVYATAPLDVPTADKKVLGLWEKAEYEGEFVQVQDGVYYLFDGHQWHEASRGFVFAGKPSVPTARRSELIAQRVEQIKAAWRRGEDAVYFPMQRLVSVKSALVGGRWWEQRGRFVAVETNGHRGRRLAIACQTKKRVWTHRQQSPANTLILTEVAPDLGAFSVPFKGIPPRGDGVENAWLEHIELYELFNT